MFEDGSQEDSAPGYAELRDDYIDRRIGWFWDLLRGRAGRNFRLAFGAAAVTPLFLAAVDPQRFNALADRMLWIFLGLLAAPLLALALVSMRAVMKYPATDDDPPAGD